jgi:hypothetical protein
MIYKNIASMARNWITGVAGSFHMHEDHGTYYLDKLISKHDKQILYISHTSETITEWKITFHKVKQYHNERK